MTKHKVSELDDIQLNAAVAKAMGLVVTSCDEIRGCQVQPSREAGGYFAPSAFWEHGGPIIEHERISIESNPMPTSDNEWTARLFSSIENASTPLVAAMRCFVASKLGAEVELP